MRRAGSDDLFLASTRVSSDVQLGELATPGGFVGLPVSLVFFDLSSYYGNQGLVNVTREKLMAQFGLEEADAWNRANVSWQIICYGLRDFQGTLSGLLMAHDEAQPNVNRFGLERALLGHPRGGQLFTGEAFRTVDQNHFCTLRKCWRWRRIF